jgi:hypothetical protein
MSRGAHGGQGVAKTGARSLVECEGFSIAACRRASPPPQAGKGERSLLQNGEPTKPILEKRVAKFNPAKIDPAKKPILVKINPQLQTIREHSPPKVQ